jgi:hypothetical protein
MGSFCCLIHEIVRRAMPNVRIGEAGGKRRADAVLEFAQVGCVNHLCHCSANPIPHMTFHGGGLGRIRGQVRIIVGRKDIPVVVRVHVPANHNLAGVAHALGRLGLLFGQGQRRQQERRQNGNDGDDNQQFYEGETAGPIIPARG